MAGVAAIGLALASIFLASPGAKADLVTRFVQEQRLDPNTTPIADHVKAQVQARPIAMIAGFLNEWMPEYFRDNLETFYKDFGQREIHRFFPSSNKTIEINTPLVDGWIRKTWSDYGKKPIVVMAHSKGAGETLLAVLKDPAMVTSGMIDRLILIQPVLLGSHIADMLLNNDAGDWPAAKPFHLLFKSWDGLWSLTTGRARKLFGDQLAAMDPRDLKAISEKIVIVRGQQEEKKCAWELQAMHLFIANFYGESDGVLMPEDELIPGLGTDLGILDTDHFDLVGKGVFTNSPKKYRRAFTRALMRELYE